MSDFYTTTNDISILQERVNELSRIRQGYTAQLGSSLYDATKDDPDLRWGREALYDGIAGCDDERSRILEQISAIESQDAPEVVAEEEAEATEEQAEEIVEQADEYVVEELPVADEELEVMAEVVEPEPVVEALEVDVVEDEPVAEEDVEAANDAEAAEEDPFAGEWSFDGPAFELEAEPDQPVETPIENDVQPETPAAPSLTCATCGAPIAENDKFCMNCGASIPATPKIAPDATASIPLDKTMAQPIVTAPIEEEKPNPEPKKEQGIECPNCGAIASPGDKFCMECGTSLAAPATPAPIPPANPGVCPSCGTPIDPSFKFCMTCGHKLI